MREKQLKCLQPLIPGARHGLKLHFCLMIIAQQCLNGLNIHAGGLLLFMSGSTVIQQHLPHRPQFTENPAGGIKLQRGLEYGFAMTGEDSH